jgi:hypothetical protein
MTPPVKLSSAVAITSVFGRSASSREGCGGGDGGEPATSMTAHAVQDRLVETRGEGESGATVLADPAVDVEAVLVLVPDSEVVVDQIPFLQVGERPGHLIDELAHDLKPHLAVLLEGGRQRLGLRTGKSSSRRSVERSASGLGRLTRWWAAASTVSSRRVAPVSFVRMSPSPSRRVGASRG